MPASCDWGARRGRSMGQHVPWHGGEREADFDTRHVLFSTNRADAEWRPGPANSGLWTALPARKDRGHAGAVCDSHARWEPAIRSVKESLLGLRARSRLLSGRSVREHEPTHRDIWPDGVSRLVLVEVSTAGGAERDLLRAVPNTSPLPTVTSLPG